MNSAHTLLTALALLATLLAPAPADAATLRGQVTDPSPHIAREARIVTSLDLSRPDQPIARAAIDPVTGEFAIDFEPPNQPFWVVVYERFRPVAGPPFDIWLPIDLMPMTEVPDEPMTLPGVDPVPLMKQGKLSLDADVVTKWLIVVFGVLGLGFAVRFGLRRMAKPQGPECAPLQARAPPPVSRREAGGLAAIVAAGIVLRVDGIASTSFDLLELSYTPGIGRPVPPPTNLADLAQEIAALHCLDLTHPPGYHVITGLFGLAGSAEWLLRVPALLSSIGTLMLLWWLFRRWSAAIGLGAAAVFSLSAPAIYFGQDATPYASTGLLALASAALLMRALERGTNRAWSAFFGYLVAGFFLHYTMAIVGLGMVGLLALLAWTKRADPRWAAAIGRATGPALGWAPLPLLWTWLHFSSHPTIAGYTRLFSDPYIPGAGLLSWTWDFWTVTAGMYVDVMHPSAIAAAVLFGLGLHTILRPREGGGGIDPTFGVLLLAMTGTYFFSVRFFYVGQLEVLAGKALYAFRWVGWFVPLVLGTAVLGAARGAGPAALRGVLVAVWIVGVGMATVTQVREPPRPDYEGVAHFVRDELENRDGLATLPAWFMRGNIAWYLLSTDADMRRIPEEGDGMWLLDGKEIALESIHPSLPFQTTARNTFIDRLWVAQVDERMYGRAKFRTEVADQAVAWAMETMVHDGTWEFDRIKLHRFVRKPGDPPGPPTPVTLSSDLTVAHHRTWPGLTEGAGFVPPDQLTLPERLGPTVLHNAPMSPGCVDWTFLSLREELDPNAPNHWYLNARMELPPDAPLPEVAAEGEARMLVTRQADILRIDAIGGPCGGPPLTLRVRPGSRRLPVPGP
ncbi:MAG: hypothetical protein GY898_22245 [Proteobacteria bacterium]|nr:hypothetical protein [Pseudomonadota bacterium]